MRDLGRGAASPLLSALEGGLEACDMTLSGARLPVKRATFDVPHLLKQFFRIGYYPLGELVGTSNDLGLHRQH